MPAVAGDAMIATSHPLATTAGLAVFGEGGNAVDAALAAATVLAVAEPTENGVGGDAFALVWHDGRLHGLNGSGRSPRVLDEVRVDQTGPRSVTVPGAVRAWAISRSASDGSASTGRSHARPISRRTASPARHGSPTSGLERPEPRSHPRGREEDS